MQPASQQGEMPWDPATSPYSASGVANWWAGGMLCFCGHSGQNFLHETGGAILGSPTWPPFGLQKRILIYVLIPAPCFLPGVSFNWTLTHLTKDQLLWSFGAQVLQFGASSKMYTYIYIQININKYINYYINSYKYHTLHPIQVVKTSLYYHVLPSKLYLLQDMFQWPHQNDHDSFKEKNTLSNQAVLPGWQHLIISMNSGEVPSAEVYIKYIFQNKSSFAMYPCQMMQGVHSKCLMSPYIYSLISNTMPKPPATTVPCKKKVNGNAGAGVASELVGRFPAWPARS